MTDFLLYTRENCSRCDKAKQVLLSLNKPFEEKNIDEYKEVLLEKYPNLKQLPVVFYKDIMIGSDIELYEMFEKEKLEQ